MDIKIKVKNPRNLLILDVDDLKDIITMLVAEKLVELIHDEITNSFYNTVFGHYSDGLVDTGEYRNSWGYYQVSRGFYQLYTTDEKAMQLEYGSVGADHDDLTINDMFEWGKRNNIPKEVIIMTYTHIKIYGTVPKPAVRRAMDRLDNEIEDIEKNTILLYRDRHSEQ